MIPAALIYAGGAAAVFAFFRLSGIDEGESRASTAGFAALWPIALPVGLLLVAIDEIHGRIVK